MTRSTGHSSDRSTDPSSDRSTGPTTFRSAVRSDARDAWVVARTELLVRLRRLRNDRRKLVATGFTLLLFGGIFPLWAMDLVAGFGRDLASGRPPVGTIGAVYIGLAVGAGYLGAASGFSQEGAGSIGPLVRTSIPPVAVSLGRLASELSRATAFLAPTVVVLLLELGLGADGPFVPLAFAVASLPVLLAALVVGRLLGDALRYLNATITVSLWAKAVVFVGVSVLAFVGSQLLLFSQFDESGDPLAALSIPAFLPGEPLQAYAAVALSPLGSTGGPLNGPGGDPFGWTPGLAVAALLLVVIPVGLASAIRLETGLLRREESATDRGTVGSRGVPRPFASFPAGRVAWRYLLRTRRDPRTLAHLTPILFGVLGMSASFVRSPESILTLGPPMLVVAGAILAGAAYCLNPLGDDVEQLPLLLTSTGTTGVLLRGRAIAGTALGLVLAVGIGTPLALVERSVLFVAWQTLLAGVLAVAGTGVALGVGALVPRFERVEYMSVERPHPSNYATFGFMFGGLFLGGVGYALILVTTGDAPGFLVAGAWAVYLAVVAVSGFGGYVYAVRTFDDLTLDDV